MKKIIFAMAIVLAVAGGIFAQNTAGNPSAVPTLAAASPGDSAAGLKPAIISYLNAAPDSANYMMDIATARKALEENAKGCLVLDIRKPDIYASGHIPGAINVPVADIGANFDKIRAAAQGKTVIAVCEIGVGAGQVAALLNVAGTKAVDLKDGMGGAGGGFQLTAPKGWLGAGYPVTPTPATLPDAPALPDNQAPIVHAVRDYFLNLPADINVIRPVDFKGLRTDMATNPDADVFLDIRKPEDFANGHIPGAMNYAFGPDLVRNLDIISEKAKGKTLVVVSASGQTAGQAVALFNLLGVHAKDIGYGFDGWDKFVKRESKASEGGK